MKRKLFALLTALLLLICLPLSVCADEVFLVIDNADLLTAEEESALRLKALELRVPYQMDVVILTEDSLDGARPQDYADDYFDYNGYGLGPDRNGVLFLLAMEERELYISTSGDARYALTDYGIEMPPEIPLSYFGAEDYYGGFDAWLDALPEYFDAYQNGNPIDGQADYSDGFYHGDQEEVIYYEEEVTPSFFLSLIIGAVVAGISVLIMRTGMNTKRSQRGAADYLVQGSYRLNGQRDIFLYSNVTKRERPQPSSSNHGGGGGSSIHTSSSGRSHGGGGRKF